MKTVQLRHVVRALLCFF